MLIVKPSNQIKPQLWATNPGLIWHNAQRMGLPMLKALFWMPEGGGDETYDYSGNNKTCELKNNTIWDGRSLYFDGTNDFAKIELWNGTGEVTLFAIFKPMRAIGSIEQICCADSFGTSDRTFQFRRDASGKLNFIPFVGGVAKSITGNTTLTTDERWKVAAVNDGTNCHIYVNGKSDATPVASGAMDNDLAAWAVGGRLDITWVTVADDLLGYVDILYRWDVALTPAQVATIHADPYGLVRPIPWWDWDSVAAGPPSEFIPQIMMF